MAPASKERILFPVDRNPPAKAMIDKFAPNTAALETPSVEGEAMALLRVVCIIRPEIDSPAPAITAASTLGRRMFWMIRICAGVPFPNRASAASFNVILEEPTNRQITLINTVAIAVKRITVQFLLFCL